VGIVEQAKTALEVLRRAHQGRVDPQLAESIRIAGGFSEPLVAKAQDAVRYQEEPEETEPEQEEEDKAAFHEQVLLHRPARDEENVGEKLELYGPKGEQEAPEVPETGVARPEGESEEAYFGRGHAESPPNAPIPDLQRARLENHLVPTPRVDMVSCSGVDAVVNFHNEHFKTTDAGEYGEAMRRFHRGGGK